MCLVRCSIFFTLCYIFFFSRLGCLRLLGFNAEYHSTPDPPCFNEHNTAAAVYSQHGGVFVLHVHVRLYSINYININISSYKIKHAMPQPLAGVSARALCVAPRGCVCVWVKLRIVYMCVCAYPYICTYKSVYLHKLTCNMQQAGACGTCNGAVKQQQPAAAAATAATTTTAGCISSAHSLCYLFSLPSSSSS